jgi:hypothetical protein
MTLAGCAARGRASGAVLPGPVWPHESDRAVPDSAIASDRPRDLPAPASSSSGVALAIIPRSQWTRAKPNLAKTMPMGSIQRITVHHDGLPPVSIVSSAQAADRIETIRHAHVDGQGWADIGYHFVIDPQGRIWEGRPLDRQGAHVRDNNPNNLGVMVLGHFNAQKPTPQALASLDLFLGEAARRFRVPMNRIRTHQELVSTECPGQHLQAHMNWTRSGRGRLATRLLTA